MRDRGVGEMAQQRRALAALAENLGLVLGDHIKCLTTAYNSDNRICRPLLASMGTCTHTVCIQLGRHTQIHISKRIYKIKKKEKG